MGLSGFGLQDDRNYAEEAMIKDIGFSLFLAALCMAGSADAKEQSGGVHPPREFVDGIVVRVNDTAIIHSQVDEKVKKGPLIRVSSYPAAESADSYERALQDEINHCLVMRKAKELNIEVEENKIDEQLERLMKPKDAPPISPQQFEQLLIHEGKTLKGFRQDLKDQFLLMYFRSRVIMPLVKITQREVENFYFKKSGVPAESVKFHLQHLFFAASADNKPVYKDQLGRAEDLYRQFSTGKPLKQVVTALDSAYVTGPNVWVVEAKDLAPQIRAEIEPLSEGQGSKPISASDGIHIFYLESKEFAGSDKFAAQKEQLEYELRQEELVVQLQRWLEQERSRAKITMITRS